MERIKGALKNTFLAGLVVVVPIVITILALYWLFSFLDGFLSPVFYGILGREIPGLGFLTEIVLIFLVGLVATNVFGSRLLRFIQEFLTRIPLVRNIYPAVKQLVETFSKSGGSSFKKVVLVEYPQKGIFSLGFLTNEVYHGSRPEQRPLLFGLYSHQQSLPGTSGPIQSRRCDLYWLYGRGGLENHPVRGHRFSSIDSEPGL